MLLHVMRVEHVKLNTEGLLEHISEILYSAYCSTWVGGLQARFSLFFTFLKGKKCGNSNQEDRIILMQKFIKTFGKKRIGVLLGDREFIGQKWLKYLNKRKIPFCVRLKDGWQIAAVEGGDSMELRKHFKYLRKGKVKSLGLCKLGTGKSAVECYITGLRAKKRRLGNRGTQQRGRKPLRYLPRSLANRNHVSRIKNRWI